MSAPPRDAARSWNRLLKVAVPLSMGIVFVMAFVFLLTYVSDDPQPEVLVTATPGSAAAAAEGTVAPESAIPLGDPTNPHPPELKKPKNYGGEFPRWNLEELPKGWDPALAANLHAFFTEMEPENKHQRDALTREISAHRTELLSLTDKREQVARQRKRVGPSLRAVTSKLRPEWITQWVRDPKHWRPETKMPNFRWDDTFDGSSVNADDAVKDIAAFLWQSAEARDIASVPRGDVAAGRELFESVGCLACHGMGEGDDRIGGWFAANLSNLGEKANYDYIVAWVKDPKVLNPATVMPNLRLSDDEARNIAAYLLSNKRPGEMDEPAPWLQDTARFERGKTYVKHFGCAGCHDIAGLENEQRIGVDLTKHGSRPKERLDFGHHTVDSVRGTKEPLADWAAPLDGAKVFAGREGRKWREGQSPENDRSRQVGPIPARSTHQQPAIHGAR